MFIPEGMTEEQVTDTIRRVAKRLANKYKFGFMTAEDLEQQAFIIVIKTHFLEKYDSSRPLENFLYSHLKNRFINFKRDNYLKPDPPCTRCPLQAFIPPDKCSAFKDKMDCKPFARWTSSNESRWNIIHPIAIESVSSGRGPQPFSSFEKNMCYEAGFEEGIDGEQIHEILLEGLTMQNRRYYLMFLNNITLKVSQSRPLFEEISNILKKHGRRKRGREA